MNYTKYLRVKKKEMNGPLGLMVSSQPYNPTTSVEIQAWFSGFNKVITVGKLFMYSCLSNIIIEKKEEIVNQFQLTYLKTS